MYKKVISFLLCVGILAISIPVRAEELFSSTAKSYVLMEANTGKIIASKNAAEALHGAGITKLMSFLLFYEAVGSGAVNPDDPVTVSSGAAAKGGTSVFLDAGEVHTFETLLQPAIVCSANDATCTLAEHIAGTEAAFVEKMNARAKEMGLSALFMDCTGLSMASCASAEDYAKIAAALSGYAGFFKYSSVWTYTFTHNSGRDTVVTNANVLIKESTYDGMSTGSTTESGYSLVASMKSGAARFICVVMGDKDSNSRFQLAREALSYAAATYSIKQIAQEDVKYKSVPISGGVKDTMDIYTKMDLAILYKKGEEEQIITTVEMDELEAPLAKGTIVGRILVTTPSGDFSVALAAGEDVARKTISTEISRILLLWLFKNAA